MRGFDNKALILFPKLENYEYKQYAYQYRFKKAVHNMIAYLESVGIEPHALYTDDLARELSIPNWKWVSTLGKADRYFISKNCDDCSDALHIPMIEYEEVYNEILRKEESSDSLTVDERFELVLQHAIKAATKIIPQYKIVIHFLVPSKAQYKVTTKPNDGKIRINVNANNLSATAFMSGSEENICDLLQLPCASRCLDVWEVNTDAD